MQVAVHPTERTRINFQCGSFVDDISSQDALNVPRKHQHCDDCTKSLILLSFENE